jgi:hypothetical protein
VKRFISLIVLLIAAPAVHADIFTRVCLSDGNTPLALADPCIPFVYRPIMVGTHLTIIISSTTDGYWTGGELTLWDANQNYGYLSGGSQFSAAGDMAIVSPVQELEGAHDANGFVFWGGYNPSAGDWFIVDYEAINPGNCSVNFYDYDVDPFNPLYEMSFTHVGKGDFNADGIINFEDFAIFGSNWRRNDCSQPDNCSGADLDADPDGHVNISDLMQFAEYWLEKTR